MAECVLWYGLRTCAKQVLRPCCNFIPSECFESILPPPPVYGYLLQFQAHNYCYPFIEIFIQILDYIRKCYSKFLLHQLAQHLLSLGHHVATQTNLKIKMYILLDFQY